VFVFRVGVKYWHSWGPRELTTAVRFPVRTRVFVAKMFRPAVGSTRHNRGSFSEEKRLKLGTNYAWDYVHCYCAVLPTQFSYCLFVCHALCRHFPALPNFSSWLPITFRQFLKLQYSAFTINAFKSDRPTPSSWFFESSVDLNRLTGLSTRESFTSFCRIESLRVKDLRGLEL